jgi:hypothetical protein
VADAAIGFADHSGWAVAVAVVPAGGWFEVVGRERFEILEPGWTMPAGAALPRQPYHAVAEQGMDRRVIEETIESAAAGSAAEIRRLRASLERWGHRLTCAGVPVGTARLPLSLDALLRSHALLHAAEGELFREALAEGASRCGVAVSRVPRREAASRAAAAAGIPLAEFESRLGTLGRSLGPPWRADHRLAASAAWVALSDAAQGSGRLSP